MPDSCAGDPDQGSENRRGRRALLSSGDTNATISRQLDELQAIESTLNAISPELDIDASPSGGPIQISFLQPDSGVEVSSNRMNSLGLSGPMEAIVESENERSPSRSPPHPERTESSKRTESGRRTLMARTKLSSQIEEIEALEDPQRVASDRPPLPKGGSFYFSHTPDQEDDEPLQRTETTGSTRKVLEAVKAQLIQQQVAVETEFGSGRESSRPSVRGDGAEVRRSKSSGDATEDSSARSSAKKPSSGSGVWAFGRKNRITRLEETTGSDGESDSARPSPLRKALTLKDQVLKPMHDLTGQYTILGENEIDEHSEEEREEKHLRLPAAFSHSIRQWYKNKAAQVRNSAAARSSKVLSRILQCLVSSPDDPNRDQEESNWMANGVQYLRVVVALALVVLDLVAVLVYQVFWGTDNFLCKTDINESGPERAPVALLGTSTALHFLDFCYLMASRDAMGKFAGLSYFKKGRDVVGGSSQARRLWNLAVFILSTIFLIANISECDASFYREEQTYRMWVLHRCLFFFLGLRSINAVQICFGLRKEVKRRLRIAVSQNKRRFVSPQQDIDLDLTYICDRLIGMSLPCVTGVVYRNDIADVARFFRERHYGKYKVYNLCEAHESKGNGNYDCSLLYHQVQKFPFRDHNAPLMETLVNFCEDATAWLNEQTGNVVAVHCQGGKGRTGTLCTALMLWCGHRNTAEEALKYFESRRRDMNKGTLPHQGVTAPSQIRYVGYLERVIHSGIDFISRERRLLRKVVLSNVPPRLHRGCKITFLVEAGGVVQYDHGKSKGLMTYPEGDPDDGEWVIHIGGSGVVISGDVAVRFFVFANENAAIPSTQHQGYALRAPAILTNGARTITYDGSQLGEQLCFAQFHTTFHDEDICLKRSEIDGVYNKSLAEFGADFSMQLLFGELDHKMQTSHDRAVRNCTLAQTVHTIMERIQPRTRKYYKGEVIYDHMEKLQGRRIVRYIVSGIAKQYMTGTDETKSVINNGVSLHGECIGAGEFDPSGLLAFIMGHACINPGTELRAWTEIVEVRELIIGGSPEDMITHLSFHNATHEDSALIWELIAYQLSSAGKKSWSLKKEVAKNVDEIAQHRIRTVKLVKEARTHFNLSSSENLLGVCPAERVVDDEGSVQSVQGHVIVLQNWMLFRETGKAFKEKPQDMMVSFENITKVLAYGKVLSIHLHNGASSLIAQDTAVATIKSPPRSPSPGSPRYRRTARKAKPKPSSSYSLPGIMSAASGSEPFPPPAKPMDVKVLPSSYPNEAIQMPSTRNSKGETTDQVTGSPMVTQSSVRRSAERVVRNSITKRTTSSGFSPPGNNSPPSVLEKKGEGAASGGTDGELTRLHFRARDSHNAASICAVLQTRLADIQAGQATTLIRSALYGPFGRVRPGYMGFGYAYPGEVATEGDEDFFKLLAMASTVCTFHAGETMVHLGTTDRNVLHILSGWVVCYTSEGEQVAQLGPGEIMGEVSFLEMGSLGARTQCVAHTDVECRVVSYAALQVLSRQPLFAARFYRGLAITCAVRCLYSLDSLNVRRRKFSTEMPTSDGDLIDHSVD